MQYVPFGKLGFKVSRLGFGTMRLPTVQDGENRIPDSPRAIAMLRYAIDEGVNYVDTAWPYHNGESENIVGRALLDGYRERVKLATKLPCWAVETREDMDRILDTQLKKLQTSYVDFYLVHALSKDRWEKMKALGVREFLDSAVRDGRIRYPSFSFHDQYPVFRDIMTSYDWQMAQIQFNYMDIRDQAGLAGVRLARARKVPLVVMEPLRGGLLARPSDDIRAIMDRYPQKRSPADWAFRFVGDYPEVATILSGMSDEQQLKDNLRIFKHVRVGGLTDADKRLIARLRAGYKRRMPIGCTGCAYCQPCPQGVAIPNIFDLYNFSCMYDDSERLRRRYAGMVEKECDASRCVQCGLCEDQCPQHLPIREWLQTVDAAAAK